MQFSVNHLLRTDYRSPPSRRAVFQTMEGRNDVARSQIEMNREHRHKEYRHKRKAEFERLQAEIADLRRQLTERADMPAAQLIVDNLGLKDDLRGARQFAANVAAANISLEETLSDRDGEIDILSDRCAELFGANEGLGAENCELHVEVAGLRNENRALRIRLARTLTLKIKEAA
jgi:hypothetical protein